MRAAQWNGWRKVASSTALALHIGYSWIIVGFGLLAIHIFAPMSLGQAAAVHAWTTGAYIAMTIFATCHACWLNFCLATVLF